MRPSKQSNRGQMNSQIKNRRLPVASATRCSAESLERRVMLTSVVVNSLSDAISLPNGMVNGNPLTDLRMAVNMANNSATPTTITFDPTVFSGNQTILLTNGALELTNATEPTTITGPVGGVTVNGNDESGVFEVDDNANVALANVTVTGGIGVDGGNLSGGATGGGIFNNGGTITLTNVTVSGNQANYGGGIWNQGMMTLTNVVVSGNQSNYGAGIENEPHGTMTLTNVTVSDNRATSLPGEGGGIWNDGLITLTNVTVSGNIAIDSCGGIFLDEGVATLTNVTVSGNGAPAYGGVYINIDYGASLALGNCIIAGNSQSLDGNGPADVFGPVTSYGNNLIGETDGSSGWNASDLTGTIADPLNPELGSLAYNGGTTQTLLPETGSPAIGAGSTALIPIGVTTDQRGLPRTYNGKVDIGAVEVQPIPVTELQLLTRPIHVFAGSGLLSLDAIVEKGRMAVHGAQSVTVSILSGPPGATLAGNTTVTSTNGLFDVSGLSLDMPGVYHLKVFDSTDDVEVDTGPVTVTPAGSMPALALNDAPAEVTSGEVINPFSVSVSDGGFALDDGLPVSLYLDGASNPIDTAPEVGGVASFSGLVIDASAGPHTLVARDADGATVATDPFTVVTPSPAVTLVFGSVPATVNAGSPISPGFTVTEMQGGSVDTGDSTSVVTLSSSGGTLSGNLSAPLSNGVATFTGLTPAAAGTYVVTAADGNDTNPVPLVFQAISSSPNHLVFTEEPTAFSLSQGTAAPTFAVTLENSSGQTVSDNSTVQVTVEIPNGAPYAGTIDVPLTGGVATFSNYYLGTVGPTTLLATDLTNSNDQPGVSDSFIVSPGPAYTLSLTGQSNLVAGGSASLGITATDDLANVATGYSGSQNFTLTSGPPGAPLGTVFTASFQSGVGTISGIVLDQAGDYTIEAEDQSLDPNTDSINFTIAPAQAGQLAFVQQPADSPGGDALPAVTVAVEDPFGNVVSGDGSAVTLEVDSGPQAVADGEITENAVNGIATFNGVSLAQAGAYTLSAADGLLSDASASNSFTVSPTPTPAWLAPASNATWDSATQTLTVTGQATIIADPGADEPSIVATGSASQLAIAPSTPDMDIHVGGVVLSDGAGIDVASVGAGRSHGNHNTLVIGTLGSATDPTVYVDSVHGSKINLEDNDLIVHTGTNDTTGQAELATLQELAATGRNVAPGGVFDGTWDGNGLTSSSVASVDASLGYEQNVLAVTLYGDMFLGGPSQGASNTWVVGNATENLGANDILVKYTYNGDLNLEGAVNGDAATIFSSYFVNNSGSPATDYAFGDLNGDGTIDGNDATIFSSLFGNGVAGSGLPLL